MPTMSVKDFILNLISTNIFKSFADSNLLQVIVFAFFFGVTMNMMGEKSARARVIIYDFSQIIFRMI
jgi:Na+/H+-dicarboxylate symporter